MTGTDRAAPPIGKNRSTAHFVVVGAAIGAILVPILAFAAATLWNGFDTSCSGNGGAEDSLGCTLRLLMLTLMAAPAGAVVGLLGGAYFSRRRRGGL